MGESARLSITSDARSTAGRVTLLRVGILIAAVAAWEIIAASGLLFRDVVPSLTIIARAVGRLLVNPDFYAHLGFTAGEPPASSWAPTVSPPKATKR